MKRSPLTRTQARNLSRKRARARKRGEDPDEVPVPRGKAPQGVEDHGIVWSEVREVIYQRCEGRCEACGCELGLWRGLEGHHRRTRRLGPDCPCNALALCHSCHTASPVAVHQQPQAARELGRIISRHNMTPAREIPVEIHGRGRVLLNCDGKYLTAS